MNTAHTPQALRLPHLQIAEASARRQAENAAFESAAARLRPAWCRDEAHEPARVEPCAPARAPRAPLSKAIRSHALTRSSAEADRYRRRLLGELDRSQRNLRRWFIAGVVAACAALALTEGSAPAQAHPRSIPAAVVAPAPRADAKPAAKQAPAQPVKAAKKRAAR